jgi:agmatine deiminase
MNTLPAEWAPQWAVQLTFPHAGSDWAYMLDDVLPCFVEIASTVARFQTCIIVCNDPEATRSLFDKKVLDNIIFESLPSNDTWARDHGGITVEDENGVPTILDFMFNGWGLKFAADHDNLITRRLYNIGVFGPHTKIEYTGMVLEGGGIESDGEGTLLTTAECLLSLNRNPHLDQWQIEARLGQLFGCKRVLWLENGYLAGDDTDSHIDTLARLCSTDTIAYVRCDNPSDEHYGALSAMESELKEFRTAKGNPYHLVPLPWPDACYSPEGDRLPATYANFLIINGAVLVPTYGVPQDRAALDALAPVFPDREIIGIDCRMLIEQHGSLHCVTMQYPISVGSSARNR